VREAYSNIREQTGFGKATQKVESGTWNVERKKKRQNRCQLSDVSYQEKKRAVCSEQEKIETTS